jgi:hypothetical protein
LKKKKSVSKLEVKDTKEANKYMLTHQDVDSANISAISWRPALLVEETGVPGENHRPVASQTNFIT